MPTDHEILSDEARYIAAHRRDDYQRQRDRLQQYMSYVGKFHPLDPPISLFEVGVGRGWFQIIGTQDGICCKGVDVSARLVQFARKLATQYNVEIDVDVASIETYRRFEDEFDVVLAVSVFEHVRDWHSGLENIYQMLKPGGVLVFSSTNKYSPSSGEYWLPLYGWLPDEARYRLRAWRQGKDILQFGIDYHQFTHEQVRRACQRIGFSRVLDSVECAPWGDIRTYPIAKATVLRILKRSSALKQLYLKFAQGTFFICIK